MEWYWWVAIMWIVCMTVETFIQFGTNVKNKWDRQNTSCTFESKLYGCGSDWRFFIVFGLLLAPLRVLVRSTELDELELRKDINYSAIIYLLPVLCLLGLYWV